MATFADIQTRVQRRVIDLLDSVVAEIPTLVNEAQESLMSIHNWTVMRAELQYITNHSSATPQILGQIPSDWKEPRGDPYYIAQQGYTRELTWEPNRTFTYRAWSPFDPNSIGPPRNLLIGEPQNATLPDPDNPDLQANDLNIEVYPRPDGLSDWNTAPGGEYRINVPYWRNLPALVNPTDTNWFTINATAFLVDFATARAFMLDWDEARANYWMAQAWGPKFDGANQNTMGGWARVAMNRDKSMAYAPGRTLTPRRDVYAPLNQWRT